MVNRRLWVLLLPLLLDLLLAFGPGISATQVVDSALATMEEATAEQGAGGLSAAELQGALAAPREALARFRDANLFGVLAWQLPSLISATSSTPLPALRGAAFAQVENGWMLAGWVIGLAMLSLLSASFYMAAIAQPLRGDTQAAGALLHQAVKGWLKLLLLYGALVVLSVPAGGTMIILLAVLGLLGPAVVSFASGATLALVMTLAFYLFFVDDAVFVTSALPWRAVWYSVRVVWGHFWSAVAFILLVNLILVGTPLAWRLLLEQDVAAASIGAMAGHAYIATGLVASGMVFLKQRLPTGRRPVAAQPSP